jgi:hypothetical protein
MDKNDPGSGSSGSGGTMALAQGDRRLVETDVARRLLSSTIPARVAYIATDGTLRILPT